MQHHRTSSPRRAPGSQRGAFLIEALIAIALFSIGVLAILGIVGKMSVNSSDSRYRIEAAQYAESVIADMRLAAWSTRATDFGVGGTRYAYWTGRIASGALPMVGAASGANQLDITFAASQATVTVSWRAPQDKDTDASANAISHHYVTTSYLP